MENFLIIYTTITLLIAIVVGINLYKKSGTEFDVKIRDHLMKYRSYYSLKIMKSITILGNVETIIIILTPILFVLIRDRALVTASAIITSSGLAVFTSQLLKLIFRRQRPVKLKTINHRGYSFPSGHSTVGVSVYLTLAVILSSSLGFAPFVIAMGLLAGLSIAFSRIYLGVHWTSDVIVGILLGFMSAGWGIYVYKNWIMMEFLFKVMK